MAWAVLLSMLILVLVYTATDMMSPRMLRLRKHPNGDMAQELEDDGPLRK